MRIGAAFAIALALAAAPAAAQDLIYRVDSAIAVISGKRMIITAKGAVKTGGWDHLRLVLHRHVPPGDMEIDFVATPPEDGAAVVQSLMPVSVTLETRLPKNGVAAVRVIAETNTITAEIVPKADHTAAK